MIFPWKFITDTFENGCSDIEKSVLVSFVVEIRFVVSRNVYIVELLSGIFRQTEGSWEYLNVLGCTWMYLDVLGYRVQRLRFHKS